VSPKKRPPIFVTLPAFSGQGLCNGLVYVRLSACLSVPSINSSSSFAAAREPPAAEQAPDIERCLPPAPERSSERAASML